MSSAPQHGAAAPSAKWFPVSAILVRTPVELAIVENSAPRVLACPCLYTGSVWIDATNGQPIGSKPVAWRPISKLSRLHALCKTLNFDRHGVTLSASSGKAAMNLMLVSGSRGDDPAPLKGGQF